MIIEKVSVPKTHLMVDDLTPDEKKILWDVMARYGASQGFSYDRFFTKGFLEWELQGVDSIKREFIAKHKNEIFPEGMKPDVSLIVNEPGAFYRALGLSFGMKKAFTEHMNQLGMGSNSVLYKFSSDDWKEYERVGIRRIVDEFERRIARRRKEAVATA